VARRSGLEWPSIGGACPLKRYVRDGLGGRTRGDGSCRRRCARAQRASAAGKRYRWRPAAPRPARSCARRRQPRRRHRRLAPAFADRVADPGRVSVDLSGIAAVGNEFAATLLVAEAGSGAAGQVTGAGAAARADLRRLLCEELLSQRAAS
jgi:hypothetical protein